LIHANCFDLPSIGNENLGKYFTSESVEDYTKEKGTRPVC